MKKIAVAALVLAPVAVFAGLYGDTPNEKHAWSVHDRNRPKPSRVTVNEKGVPSDAIVLFDGTKASFEKNWSNGKGDPAKWECCSEVMVSDWFSTTII